MVAVIGFEPMTFGVMPDSKYFQNFLELPKNVCQTIKNDYFYIFC